MKLIDKLLNRIAHTERIKEILAPEFAGAIGTSIDNDDWQYRRLTQVQRDLEPMQQERAINISLYMYDVNPLAKRLIQLPIQAIESAGVQFQSKERKYTDLWNEWWGNSNEGFSAIFFKLYEDAKLTGEIHWPIAINSFNADMELAYIDPINVKEVRMLPGNVLQPEKVILKDSPNAKIKTEWDVIRRVGGVLTGDIFHLGFNKPINSSRGRPALIALLDWIDLYDQSLFNEAERWSMMKNFIWHFIIEGADDDGIKQFIKNQGLQGGTPPRPGSMLITNEKVTSTAVTPDLKAADASEMARLQQQHIFGGAGFPDFFFASGQYTNVATAREMYKPTIWMLEQDQLNIKRILTTLFKVRLQASVNVGEYLDSGRLDSATKDKFTIKTNDIFERDLVMRSSVLNSVTNSVTVAMTNKLCDKSTARKIWIAAVREYGVEDIDQETIELALGKDKEKKELEPDQVLADNYDEKQPGFLDKMNQEKEFSNAEMIKF